jgi:8-amino-7-oxononanoate synthase
MRDIAIVGIGCRFPGADGLAEYWRVLQSGQRQIRPVPADRWDHSHYYDPGDRRSPGKSYTDQIGYVDRVHDFDTAHYRIPPRRASRTDPQHRLLLDVSREAIQDAGWERKPFDRANTGVYFALSVTEYTQLVPGVEGIEASGVTGQLPNMAAAMVSQHFNLGGPSFILDSSCSSSLTALHEAVTALRAGVCSSALVGGVYLSLVPQGLVGFSKVGVLSPTGHCRPFDKRADGFVLGEGVGVVALRPLEDAQRAGDRVYAVICGIACRSDGATDGPMTPSETGQVRAMTSAYKDAGVPATSIGLIETHSTATLVGDRVELNSLRAVRQAAPAPGSYGSVERCYISSVKSLIGHTLTASGMASLIKMSLALHHQVILPHPETELADPQSLEDVGLELPAGETIPWQATDGVPRRAAINAFGFGGTDVHVVLEEVEPAPPAPAAVLPQLFLFSAASADGLRRHAAEILGLLGSDRRLTPAALSATLAGRTLLRFRLAVVAADLVELAQRIRQALPRLADGDTGHLGEGVFAGQVANRAAAPMIGLVFPGQGSQSPGMLRDLYERYPVFRKHADGLNDSLVKTRELSVLAAVYGDEAATAAGMERLTGTDVCQPTLGVMELSMARLAAACGVVGQVTFGHSVGVFPAAAAAGVLDDDETVRLMADRGAAMGSAEQGKPGGMLAVRLSADEVVKLAEGIDEVWVACYNQPRQTVVAGTIPALAEVARRCADQGVGAHPLAVSNAFHTPLLDGVREGAAQAMAGYELRVPQRTYVSSVSGTVTNDPVELRELWSRHASAPVRFAAAARSAYDAGARIFVQVSGGSSLLGAIRHTLVGVEACQYVALSGEEPDGCRTFLGALGQLAVLGVDVDPWAPTGEAVPPLTLPVTPLANRKYPTPQWRDVDRLLRDARPPAQTSDARPAGRASADGAPDRRAANQSAPDRRAAAAAGPARTSFHRAEKGQHVNQIIDLFRDQIAYLRSLDGEPEPDLDQAGAAPARLPDRVRLPAPVVVAAVPMAAPPPVAVEPALADGYRQVRDAVFTEVARISAFPVEQFAGNELLVQDLGFDSLMIRELMTALGQSWPQLVGYTADLPKRPTLHELVTEVSLVLGIAPAERPALVEPAVASTTVTTTTTTGPVSTGTTGTVSIATAVSVTAPDDVALAVRPENGLAELAEVVAFPARRAGYGRDPYFRVHEGNARDVTRVGGRELLSFASYNYLGLSGHPKVNKTVIEAIKRYGTSVSASRFLSGSRPIHDQLEERLSALLGTERSLTMVSGHATNVSVIGHLVGPGDLIVHDELSHDSILQGCKLSGATRRSFAHNDAASLEAVLGRHRPLHRRCLVVVEGVYSMDGDIAALPAILDIKERFGALLMIDEAHSIGVVGPHGGGVGDYFGVDRSRVDIWVGTMSKSLASCGGYVAGSTALIDYLKYTTPGFVYSVGITPANAAAALGALTVMRDEPERLVRLGENSRLFLELAREAGVNTGTSADSAVVPCIIGESRTCLELAHSLFDRGISVDPIMYPGVPDELARLRFFITSEHTPAQLERTVEILGEELDRLGVTRQGKVLATASA